MNTPYNYQQISPSCPQVPYLKIGRLNEDCATFMQRYANIGFIFVARDKFQRSADLLCASQKPKQQEGRYSRNAQQWGYYASTAFPPRLAPPLKRPRLMPPARSQHPKQQKQQPAANAATVPDLNQLKKKQKGKIGGNQFVISMCCRQSGHPDLWQLQRDVYRPGRVARAQAKLLQTAVHINVPLTNIRVEEYTFVLLPYVYAYNGFVFMFQGDSTTALLCVLCKVSFPSAWELMVHAQAAHMINIYELGTRPQSPRSAPSPPQSPSQHQKESSPSPQDFQSCCWSDPFSGVNSSIDENGRLVAATSRQLQHFHRSSFVRITYDSPIYSFIDFTISLIANEESIWISKSKLHLRVIL
ncbi:hypothetical protein WN51_02430 [Melipona quadrifasciata]|uniref:C2H2-type domain-containing protein n=1 Tax=Melipona quadrifasciata TaxID=166423 RepID=A0A0M8ZXG0_9HYME|nr:hypothetical protein WN51_02430 [Melipona quadrifasciata]